MDRLSIQIFSVRKVSDISKHRHYVQSRNLRSDYQYSRYKYNPSCSGVEGDENTKMLKKNPYKKFQTLGIRYINGWDFFLLFFCGMQGMIAKQSCINFFVNVHIGN